MKTFVTNVNFHLSNSTISTLVSPLKICLLTGSAISILTQDVKTTFSSKSKSKKNKSQIIRNI